MSLYAGTFNGLALGVAPYTIDDASGFEDLPALRGANTPKSGEDGFWPAEQFLDALSPKMALHIVPTASITVSQACFTLRQKTPRSRLGSYPFVFASGTEMMLMRVTGRSIVRDKSGLYARAAIQWETVDPRVYEEPERQIVLSQPAIVGGAQVPLWLPIRFLGAAATSSADAYNSGNEDSFPAVTITGPAPNPTLINQRLGFQLRFAFTLGATETLTLDTRNRIALLNGQEPRNPTGDSTWWALKPGSNVIQYRSDVPDPASTATLYVRSAWA